VGTATRGSRRAWYGPDRLSSRVLFPPVPTRRVALKLTDHPIDHDGNPLLPGVYATATPEGTIVGYRARWREEDEDGVRRNASKRFSARRLGSLDRARCRSPRAGAADGMHAYKIYYPPEQREPTPNVHEGRDNAETLAVFPPPAPRGCLARPAR
jgi:hypothetical protein